MQPDSSYSDQQEELNDDDLEFKPVVKYTAVGLGLVALLGIEYATYHLGFKQGFHDGVTSEVVSEAVNAAAVENLTHFMQAATADDETLLAAVRDRDTGLAWIRNPDVRREAEWTLALALINRGKVMEAADLLRALFDSAGTGNHWSLRAAITARAMAAEGQLEEAIRYYRLAAAAYATLGKKNEQIAIFSELLALIAAPSEAPETQLAELERLQQDITSLGEDGKPLLAVLLAHMGRIHRAHGNDTAALSCFEQALHGADLNNVPALAAAAVTMGSALLENGQTERAAQLLRDGISRLGEHPGDAAYLAAALRDLARIELDNGQPDSALALLYRAEGAAMGRIPDYSSYWLFLYDQRGWVNFTKGAADAALADFTRALSRTDVPEELRVQPLEGAGNCSLSLGQAEDAVKYLQESILLRTRHYAGDKASLGRVYLLLAQAYDFSGSTREAVNTYALAIANLPEQPGEDSDRFNAMMARAYALSQIRDWGAAIQAWDALRPFVTKGSPRSREVEEQFALCRRNGASMPDDIDDGEDTEGANEPAPH